MVARVSRAHMHRNERKLSGYNKAISAKSSNSAAVCEDSMVLRLMVRRGSERLRAQQTHFFYLMILATIVASASGLSPVIASWSEFRGNAQGSGWIPANYTNQLYDVGALQWRYQTGNRVYSSPATSTDGATIYVGGWDTYLYALSTTGTLTWRYQTGNGIHSSPAISADGSTIYVGSTDAYLYALTNTGALKWRYQIGSFVYSSPAISPDGSTIYVGGWDGYLYALTNTGMFQWRYQTGSFVHSSPAISPDGFTIYVGSADHYLYALTNTGALKWRFQTGNSIFFSSPAISADGSTIYVGSDDTFLYALDNTGALKWRYQTGNSVSSSPAISPDGITIYVGSVDTYLYALTNTGSLKWRFQTGSSVSSSPVISPDGSTTYVGSDDSYLYALTNTGTLKWRYRTSGLIQSSPAISPDGSTIYVGSQDYYLYALVVACPASPRCSFGNPLCNTLVDLSFYCTAGSYCPKASTSFVCIAGSYCPVCSIFPMTCPSGSYCPSNSSSPMPCPAGSYCRSNSSSPLPCPVGTFCPIGSFTPLAYQPNWMGSAWPEFHGNAQRSGWMPGTHYNQLYEVGVLSWRYQTGSNVYSSPAVSFNGVDVYVGSTDSYVYALRKDGTLTLSWRYQTGSSISSSPALSPDYYTIYVGSDDAYLYALTNYGTLSWRYKTGNAIRSSPALSNGGVYIYVGSLDGYLYKLWYDGTFQWRYQTGDAIHSSPAIAPDGYAIYVGSYDSYVYALDIRWGTLKWRYQTGNQISSSPAISADGSTIYVGSADGYLYALTNTGTLKWRYQTGNQISSPAISPDGSMICVGSQDSYLYVVTNTGSLKWRYQTGNSVSSSPAISADGSTIYVGSADNFLYALTNAGTLKWRYLTGGVIDSSPALSPDGSTIYVGSEDAYLYALGVTCPTSKSSNCSALLHQCNTLVDLSFSCSAGSYCPSKSNTSLLCPAGSYCPVCSIVPMTCPSGSYCPSNSSSPIACPFGSYCPTNSFLPLPCPLNFVGYYCPANAGSPLPCPSQFYCPSSSTNPIGCPSSFYCPAAAYSPIPCPAGSYCPSWSSSPTVCQAAAYCPANSSFYIPCPSSFYCPATSSSPISCPAGSYCPSSSSSAITCPAAAYCPANSSSLIECPSSFYCPSNSSSPSPCPAGFYCPSQSTFMTPCPAGSYCPENSYEPLACPAGFYCQSESFSATSCPATWTSASNSPGCDIVCTHCGNNGTCVFPFGGVNCGTCLPNYYMVLSQCYECPKDAWPTILFLGILVLIVLLLYLYLNIDFAKILRFRVLMQFVQFSAFVISVGLIWPDAMTKFYQWTYHLSLDITIWNPECYASFSIIEKMVMVTVAFVLLIILGIVIIWYYHTRYHQCKMIPQDSPNVVIDADLTFYYKKRWLSTQRTFIIMISLAYVPFLKLNLSFYNCQPTADGSRLVADVTVACNSFNTVFTQVVATILWILFGLGLPSYLAYLFWLKKHRVLLSAYQLQVTEAVSEWYQPATEWFEVIMYLRKFVNVLVLTVIQAVAIKLLFNMAINFVYLIIIYFYFPYVNDYIYVPWVNMYVNWSRYSEYSLTVCLILTSVMALVYQTFSMQSIGYAIWISQQLANVIMITSLFLRNRSSDDHDDVNTNTPMKTILARPSPMAVIHVPATDDAFYRTPTKKPRTNADIFAELFPHQADDYLKFQNKCAELRDLLKSRTRDKYVIAIDHRTQLNKCRELLKQQLAEQDAIAKNNLDLQKAEWIQQYQVQLQAPRLLDMELQETRRMLNMEADVQQRCQRQWLSEGHKIEELLQDYQQMLQEKVQDVLTRLEQLERCEEYELAQECWTLLSQLETSMETYGSHRSKTVSKCLAFYDDTRSFLQHDVPMSIASNCSHVEPVGGDVVAKTVRPLAQSKTRMKNECLHYLEALQATAPNFDLLRITLSLLRKDLSEEDDAPLLGRLINEIKQFEAALYQIIPTNIAAEPLHVWRDKPAAQKKATEISQMVEAQTQQVTTHFMERVQAGMVVTARVFRYL